MPKDTKDVVSGLLNKGFLERGGHHKFYHLHVGGKKTAVYTKVSHGGREIHDNLLGKMARQVKLSRRDFLDLIDCPLSLEEYLRRLRDAGEIEP